MTRQQACKEAGVIHEMITNWWGKTPWDDAIQSRWFELTRYSLGNSDTLDEDWTLESIAHLEGAPKNSE